jgi:hypothetical protein
MILNRKSWSRKMVKYRIMPLFDIFYNPGLLPGRWASTEERKP